jgi:hypothetical protein
MSAVRKERPFRDGLANRRNRPECFADVYRRSNDRSNALAALRQGQAIMDRLAKLSPDNANWKNELA